MQVKAAPSFRDSVRFWWINYREPAGLALAVVALAALLLLFRPLGHPTLVTGVVTAINPQVGGKLQSPFNAWVDLGGGNRTAVQLGAGHGCVAGSRITLQKARFSFGEHYAVAGNGCGASTAP